MTKEEENLQNMNTKFKIKLILKPGALPGTSKQDFKLNLGRGIFDQMTSKGNSVVYNRGEFKLDLLEKVFKDLDKRNNNGNRKNINIRREISE